MCTKFVSASLVTIMFFTGFLFAEESQLTSVRVTSHIRPSFYLNYDSNVASMRFKTPSASDLVKLRKGNVTPSLQISEIKKTRKTNPWVALAVVGALVSALIIFNTIGVD